MNLLDRLNDDIKESMINKDKEKLSVIRMLKASLQNEAIKQGNQPLSADDELSILSREVKQRNDSLQEFKQAGRQDLVEKIQKELAYVSLYMPEQLSEEELTGIVDDTIKEVNATSKADIGKVMNAIMPKVKGKANGADVNRIVKQQLN